MHLLTICQHIKLSKDQIPKMIQPGGSFDSWLANFGKNH